MNFLKFLLLAWVVKSDPKVCGDRRQPIYLTSAIKECQVVLGDLLIDGDNNSYNTVKQLKEIQGKLIVKSSMPENMKNDLLVGELHIQGNFKVGPRDFVNIKASKLTIEGVYSNLTFNMNPKSILIKKSTIQVIKGLDGAKLKNLTLANCQVDSFSLPNVESLSSLYVQGFEGDFRAYLPNLKYLDSAFFENILQDSISLDVAMITNSLKITGNGKVKTIDLPNLRKAGLIHVYDNFISTHFKAPLLESSVMKLSSHQISLDVPKNLTWSGMSYFNANNFCQDYNSIFKENGLQFETRLDCLPFCYSNVTVTVDNLRRVRKCHEIGGTLTIDKNSPADLDLFLLSSVNSLVVSGYHGLFNVPNLQLIKGALMLKKTNFTISSIQNVKSVQSLVLKKISRSIDITYLLVKESIHIQDCLISDISGLLAPKLKSLTIRDSPSLKLLQIMGLKSVDEVIISNSGLAYFSSRDYLPFDINKRVVIEGSRSSGLTLKAKNIFGTFVLEGNYLLEELNLSDLEVLESPIKNIDNPNLKEVKLSPAMLDSHPRTISYQGIIDSVNMPKQKI